MVISEPTASVPARYRLIEEVGQGGMAVVYRAKDDSLKREVAIKVLHRHLSAEPESKARLEREAQAVAKLRHDNILEIYDYSGVDAESAYIVTEFIDGQTLKQFLATRTIKHPEVAVLIASELCCALAHAHDVGIIHRDIKPENVMIRKDGLLKLMDFGIAQVIDLERMTVTGQLLGSPAYMAPELVEGKPLDVRTDVFSVGILLYQMATGALPFSGKNPHEVLRRITDGKFPDPRGINPRVSAGLARVIARALAHDPSARHPNMGALLKELAAELADAGLGTPREELAAYFESPNVYEQTLPTRMTPALTSAAEKQMALKNSAHAIECWNRVLAYAPDNPVVKAALRRWEDRGRRRRIARLTVGGAALVGAVALVVGLVSQQLSRVNRAPESTSSPAERGDKAGTAMSSPEHAPSTTSSVAQNQQDPSPEGGGAPPLAGANPGRPEGTPGGPLRLVHLRPPGERAGVPALRRPDGMPALGRPPPDPTSPTEAPTGAATGPGTAPAGVPGVTRTFTLGPTPQNVDVYLDGERQFAYDTDHRTLTVAWNSSHLIEFRSPSGCCFVERIEIGPDKRVPPENVIARKLKWKPARLVVTTRPAASNVRIMVRDPAHPDRATVVGPGDEANIPFLVDDEGQKEIELSVDSGGTVFADHVTVRAGERKAVEVPLHAGAASTTP
jgi:serine/threonine-protein kinase